MKEIAEVSWKLPQREMSCQHFREIPPPSENNHVYSICYSNSRSDGQRRIMKILIGAVANPGKLEYFDAIPGALREWASPVCMHHLQKNRPNKGIDPVYIRMHIWFYGTSPIPTYTRHVYQHNEHYVGVGSCFKGRGGRGKIPPPPPPKMWLFDHRSGIYTTCSLIDCFQYFA